MQQNYIKYNSNMEGMMHSNMRNSQVDGQCGYHHGSMQGNAMESSQLAYHGKVTNASVDSNQSQLGSPASAYSYHHVSSSSSSSAPALENKNDDLLVYVICSIADFVNDLATALCQKSGKEWIPKVIAKQKKRTRRDARMALATQGRPKRPPTSYFMFIEHTRKSMKETGSNRAISTKFLAEMWKNLSENEKEVWERKSSEQKELYCREMAAYKEQTDNMRNTSGNASSQQSSSTSANNTNTQNMNNMNMTYSLSAPQQHQGNQMW